MFVFSEIVEILWPFGSSLKMDKGNRNDVIVWRQYILSIIIPLFSRISRNLAMAHIVRSTVFQNFRLQRMTWQIVDFPFHQYMALCHHDLVSSSYNSFWQFGVTTVFMFRKQKFESKQGKINNSKFSFVSLSQHL